MNPAEDKDAAGVAIAADDPLLTPWRDAAEGIRTTAKWLVTLFGGIAAVLVGTAPLTGVGDLSGDDRTVAMLFGFIALVGLALVIWRVSNVLLPETTSLAEALTSGTLKDFRNQVDEDGWGYLGAWATTLEQFKNVRDLEFATLLDVHKRLADPELSEEDRESYEAAVPVVTKRVEALELTTGRLLAKGAYHEVRTRFERARRWLFVGGLIAAVGIAGFLTTVNAKKGDDEKAPTAAVSMSRAGTVALTAEATERFRPFIGPQCPAAAVPVLVLEGGEEGPWRVVVRKEQNCRPVSFLLSREEGIPRFR